MMDKGLVKENFIFSGDIMQDFENLAFEHVDLQGASDKKLNRYGACWILISYHIEIERVPRHGEIGWANTRNGRVRQKMGLYPRYFEFRDSNGDTLVKCGSLFSIMDTKTRGFADTGALDIDFDDQTMPDDISVKGHFPSIDTPIQRNVIITENNIDKNGHMNNKEYVRHGLETIGLIWDNIKSLYIRYENEIRLGETLSLSWGQDGDTWLLVGTGEERKIFRMAVKTR